MSGYDELTPAAYKVLRENEQLRAEIERRDAAGADLSGQVMALQVEVERLTKERDFARDAVVQKRRQYDEDMQTMQAALNREIEARRALEGMK